MNIDSNRCACCAPSWRATPLGTRTTSGIGNCPPDMKGILAAPLTIESSASSAKLMVMISTTGRMPDERRADAEPGEAVFGDRRVAHAPFAVFGVKPFGDAIAAAIEADILAEREDRLIGFHLGIHGPVERLPVEHFL